jgi:bifunctional N-acetylglucosamine-1-phosphate-uridyltransferase/glucosamine-1-phosphate-acetyltransferase GlmU-like protein
MPKVLVPVAGVPMLDRLLDLYRASVGRVVVVVHPGFASDVERHLQARGAGQSAECAVQPSPTGMLDAILLGMPAVEREAPSSIWVTWCDQVAVHPKTIDRLAERTAPQHDALVLPTVIRPEPYIHLERETSGRIVRVLHRREGDAMPAVGESDMGVFAMSPSAYRELLPAYAREVEIGQATGERNFLPFIPWVAARASVSTFPSEDPMEAVGINTPEELHLVERYLRR